MEENHHEKLLNRLESRRKRGSGNIPMIPTPSSFYTHVSNRIDKNDPIFQIIQDEHQIDEITSNWRCGQLNIPNKNMIMRLLRMPERHQLALLRSTGGDGTACGKLWAPSLIFPLFLADNSTLISHNLRNWITSKNILEVGAGWAGTPSLTAHQLGASHVAITDGEDVMVKCLDVNIAAELTSQLSSSSSSSSSLSAHVLRWGNKSDSKNILQKLNLLSFDCVLASDCIYDTSTIINLFDTITNDLGCNRIIFCWESRDHRYDAEEQFFQQLFSFHFRIKYFTSTLLSDLSFLTSYDEVQVACNEIRSYLDSSPQHSADSNTHTIIEHSSSFSSSTSSSFSTSIPTPSSTPSSTTFQLSKSLKNITGNDLNILFAERIPPSQLSSPTFHSQSSHAPLFHSQSSINDNKITSVSRQNSSSFTPSLSFDGKESAERNVSFNNDKKQSKYETINEEKKIHK